MEKERKPRSMSDPTALFESEKEEKKGHGLSNFLHKLPFVSWKHHHHHASCSLEGDDEFCDIEEELKKQGKKEREEPDKTEESFKQEKIIVLVNDSTDTECDSQQVQESERELHQDQINKHSEEEDSTSDAKVENKTVIAEEKEQVLSSSEDEPYHEPPASPLPRPTKSCLKRSCWENRNPPPLRKRSISLPEGDPNIVCRLNRHVHFSPDTVDPLPRNCRYREWIERHSNHVKGSVNIKHEKRKQQLRQIHSLDINDYLSRGSRRYNQAMVTSPMPSLCCDMFL